MGLCERFGCLPSALLAEDADLLRLVQLEYLAREENAAALEPAAPPIRAVTLANEPVEAVEVTRR